MSYMLDFDSGTKILQLAICGCCIGVGPLPLVYRLSRHPILESAPSLTMCESEIFDEYMHTVVSREQLQDLISSKCGAKTQAVVALSSASAETMGLISMYKDFGTHMSGVVLGDASAALSIVARRGLGKLRNLDTNYLWIQEKAAKGDLNFKKVAGVDNGADLFTKTLSCDEIQSHIHKLTPVYPV